MGCDLHVSIETRSNWSHNWVFEWAYEPLRNYILFAKLADVRNDDKDGEFYVSPISSPRGLPADATRESKAYLNTQDNHSHSWLSGEEFQHHFPLFNDSMKWRRDKNRYPTDFELVVWASIVTYNYSLDVRVLFAFDN